MTNRDHLIDILTSADFGADEVTHVVARVASDFR